MFEQDDSDQGVALLLVLALAIFIAFFTIAIATATALGGLGPKKAAALPAEAPAHPAGMVTTVPQVLMAVVTTRIYFDVGQAALPDDPRVALEPVIVELVRRSEARAVISGFHDATGDATANAELAKQRALAVRDVLMAAGIPESRIDLRKPELTMGGADPREARRVEVSAQ